MHAVLALALAAAPAAGAAQVDASALKISQPTAVVEIDTGKLKGDPLRLAWSPEGTDLYLQVAESDRFGNLKLRHYRIKFDGKAPSGIEAEPDWAGGYWINKSAQSSPASASFKIVLESKQEQVRGTAAPRGGDLAGMGGGSSGGGGGAGPGAGGGGATTAAAMGVANQSQAVVTQTMKLKGEVVGEWVNAPPVPGATFGWSPKELNVIAFADRDGAVVIMDGEGRKQRIDGTKDASLPAWSDDGTRIAFLQKKDRKKLTLLIVEVGR